MEPDEPIDEDDEDADVPVVPGPVTVRRLPDLGGWELYKVIDDDEEIRTVSLRVVERGKSRTAAFAIFHDVNEEPVETGEMKLAATDAVPLDDEGRVRLLERVLKEKDPDFDDHGQRLDFAFTRPREDDDDGEDDEEE